MALPFALRSRIRLREEPERTRSDWVPPVALPVAAYWAVMGLLTYGVSQGPSVFSRMDGRGERPPFRSQAFATHYVAPPATRRPAVSPGAHASTAPASPAIAPPPRDVEPALESPRAVPSRALTMRVEAFHDLTRVDESRRWQTTSDPADDAPEEPPRRSSRHEGDAPPTGASRHVGHRTRGEAAASPSHDTHDDAPVATRREPKNDPPPPSFRPSFAAVSVPTCESVLATANDEMDLTAARGAPDVSRDAYASVLENGAYLSPCAVPEGMRLEICAAVRGGRPVGVSVLTHPADGGVSACVRRAVASLVFPNSPRLDVTRTHFDAIRSR